MSQLERGAWPMAQRAMLAHSHGATGEGFAREDGREDGGAAAEAATEEEEQQELGGVAGPRGRELDQLRVEAALTISD